MKNNRLPVLFVLLLAMATLGLKAQDYEPIIHEGNEWHTLEIIPGLGLMEPDRYITHIHWFSGDTIIDNLQYKKVYRNKNYVNAPYLVALLREENGKVWCRKRMGNFSTEKLLYDFSANVGEAMTTPTILQSFHRQLNPRKYTHMSYWEVSDVRQM